MSATQQVGNGSTVMPVPGVEIPTLQEAPAAVADETGMFTLKKEKFFFKKPSKSALEKAALKGETLSKREDVILDIPIPTLAALDVALQDEKQKKYILSLVEDAITEAVRSQVSPTDDFVPQVNNQEELDLSKLSIQWLANEPKSDRRGRGISKEIWEAFAKDYIEVMPEVTGKSVQSCTLAATLFAGRLLRCKTDKPVLAALQKFLDLWAQSSEKASEFEACYIYLTEKTDAYLNSEDENLLENL